MGGPKCRGPGSGLQIPRIRERRWCGISPDGHRPPIPPETRFVRNRSRRTPMVIGECGRKSLVASRNFRTRGIIDNGGFFSRARKSPWSGFVGSLIPRSIRKIARTNGHAPSGHPGFTKTSVCEQACLSQLHFEEANLPKTAKTRERSHGYNDCIDYAVTGLLRHRPPREGYSSAIPGGHSSHEGLHLAPARALWSLTTR